MSATKILIEIKTNGLRASKFDDVLAKAVNRFSDCFTSAGANVESCTGAVQPSEVPEIIGLTVRSEPPPHLQNGEE
jgi:hypothetical protein